MNEAQHRSMQPCELDCEDRGWTAFAQDCGRTIRDWHYVDQTTGSARLYKCSHV